MAKIHEGRNRATAAEAASFVEEFDRLEQVREVKLAALDAEFKQKKRDVNKGINADQKGVLDDAKKMGVKKGVIRALADPQRKRRKAQDMIEAANERADSAIEALEDEDQVFAKDIREALGDDFAGLPLGKAAVEASEKPAKPRKRKGPDPVAKAAADAWDAEDAPPPATH